MALSLLMASCAPAVVEEEEAAPPPVEEVALPEEEEVAPPEEEEEALPTPPAPTPLPAEFEVISLDIEQSEVTTGETVNITAEVKNTGGSEGTYTAVLTVDGVKFETKDVTLAAGAKETVTFLVTKNTPGTYDIALAGLSGTLEVLRPAPAIPTTTVEINTANGTRRELLAEAALKKLLAEYDVSKWIFTREILIEEGAIPHSRPILTITPRDLNDELLFFSSFLHEQCARFLYPDRFYAVNLAIGELRQLYPEAPVGGTEAGAKDEDSNYRHLISNFLEFSAMVEVVGEELAVATMERKHAYTWVYETVLSDADKIEEIARKYGLIIE